MLGVKPMKRSENFLNWIKMLETEIFEAKKKLYSLLLRLDPENITDNEADIMYSLSKDDSIQSVLNSSIAKSKNQYEQK